MKYLLALATAMAISLPLMSACAHTVSESDQTTRHMNGSVSHDETTVKQNDLTGTETTVHEKSNANP